MLITLQSRFFCISAACSLICLSFSYNSLIHCLHHLHLPCTLSIDSVMSSCVVHVPLAAMVRFHGSVVAEWPCVGSANSVTHSTILGRYVQSNTLRLLSSNFIPFISFVFFTTSRFASGRSLPHFLPSFSLRPHRTYCLPFFLCLLLSFILTKTLYIQFLNELLFFFCGIILNFFLHEYFRRFSAIQQVRFTISAVWIFFREILISTLLFI